MRKMLGNKFGRKDAGGNVEAEGANAQHAYERGCGRNFFGEGVIDQRVKWRRFCFQIHSSVPMSVRYTIPLPIWLVFVWQAQFCER